MGSSGNPRCAGTQVLPPLSLRITEPPAPDSRFQKPGELLASATRAAHPAGRQDRTS